MFAHVLRPLLGSSRTARAGRESGQVLVLAALAMAVLLGAAALTVDVGVTAAQKRQAQAAADAAALAGATDLPGVVADNTQARTDANSSLTSNLPGGLTNVVTEVNSPPVNDTANHCPTASHAGDAGSVQVCIKATVPSFFLGVLNVGATTLYAHAVATGSGALGTPPIAVLDPAQQDSLDVAEDAGSTLGGKWQPSGSIPLDCNGASGTTFTVNGPVYTNSTASDAEEVHADCSLVAASNHIAGSSSLVCDDTCGSFNPAPAAGSGAQLPDPLAYLSPPTTVTAAGTFTNTSGTPCTTTAGAPPSCNLTGTNAATVNPGVWKNLVVQGSGTLTLNPGTYVVTGSLQITGTQSSSNTGTASGKISGSGVTLYLTCPSSTSPYWAACPSGGGVSGQSNNAQCPADCSGAAATSGCPNTCTPGAFLNLQTGSGGKFTLSSPTSGTYQGLLIFMDRNNYVPRPSNTSTESYETFNMEVILGANDAMAGTIYGEGSNLWLTTKTSSCTGSYPTPCSVNSCIIANSVGLYGPGNLSLTCSPAYNAIPSNVPYGGASLTE